MIRLAARVRREHAEVVLAELLELAPAGVEELDLDGDIVEYAVYGTPGEIPTLPDLRGAVGEALVEITTEEISDDWHERWRSFHRPVLIVSPAPRIGAAALPSLHVRPPWEEPRTASVGAQAIEEIVIDPGQAFGTGAHATTRLCLELLLALAASSPERGSLLDLGTGSGVLAIAAARLGFAPVRALDNDPESVRAARMNAAVNHASVEIDRFDLRAAALDGTHTNSPRVLLANLLRPLLLELADRLLEPPAELIVSGLLREETDEVAGAFRDRHGLTERERREVGEWAAVWLGGGSRDA